MHRLSDKLVSFIEPEAIEPQALLQASRISRMPFIYDHVALMPDVHLGMGATVGSVIATEGAITGSMATGTFIATGLGNEASFMSAPHGAGRRMSRGEAKRTFTLEDLQVKMEGITARLRPSLIDEHPDAYKDVAMVIDRSSELVKVEHTLRQILNVKGD